MLKVGMRLPFLMLSRIWRRHRNATVPSPTLSKRSNRRFGVPQELLNYRPEALRLRGELRLRQRQTELAEADFVSLLLSPRR